MVINTAKNTGTSLLCPLSLNSNFFLCHFHSSPWGHPPHMSITAAGYRLPAEFPAAQAERAWSGRWLPKDDRLDSWSWHTPRFRFSLQLEGIGEATY